MSRTLSRCIVKSTGAVYYVQSRHCWGQRQVTVDPEGTGWHKNAKEARLAAEKAGWVWVCSRNGETNLVHNSAAKHYERHGP